MNSVRENNDEKHIKLNILVYSNDGQQIANDLVEFITTYDADTDTYQVYNQSLQEVKV